MESHSDLVVRDAEAARSAAWSRQLAVFDALRSYRAARARLERQVHAALEETSEPYPAWLDEAARLVGPRP